MFKFLILLSSISFSTLAAEFTITIDDPNTYSTPLLTPIERDAKILSHLDSHNTKAALFVCGKRVDSRRGERLLKRWDDKGHLIGNHSYSHHHYHADSMTFEEFSEDFLKVEALIEHYENFEKVFRFPFLKAGNTIEKRDLMRNFLRQKGYKRGYVSIDASDYYISTRLVRRLQENPNADLSGFKQFYLEHMWERAQYYDGLARRVLGRSPKHSLLIHHNLLNALFLGDLITYFKDKGWTLINAKDALSDPIYQLETDVLPSGESIIWSAAKENGVEGLRYPGEDGKRYERGKMLQLGL